MAITHLIYQLYSPSNLKNIQFWRVPIVSFLIHSVVVSQIIRVHT